MHMSRRVRFAAATAAVLAGLTASGVFAATEAQAMPSVSTMVYVPPTHAWVVSQTWNCQVTTHTGIWNPFTGVRNGCPSRVWLHGTKGETYCVSGNTFDPNFNGRFVVSNVQISANLNPC